jgi:hemerythrin-like domain-containing protein
MNPGFHELTQLKADHDVFRMQLDVMEAALELGAGGGAVLRDLSRDLFLKLRTHVHRESRLAVSVSRHLARIDGAQLAKFAIEHETAVETLRVIRRGLPAFGSVSLHYVQPAIRLLVSTLRRHMDEQERLLFPMLRDELAKIEAERASAPARAPVAYALARSLGLLNPAYGRSAATDDLPPVISS